MDKYDNNNTYRSYLDQPKCGDGTSFAFYMSKPPQRYDPSSRILIEFGGGGACWDANTCSYQSNWLTLRNEWDSFIGLSCTEIQIILQKQNKAISMLCAQSTFGDVDLTSYTTIVVPYCTQDVHTGDNSIVYNNDADDDDDNNNDENNDSSNSNTVYHHGAHNVMAVLRYVYQNFPHPEHIFITGCSAGGTALPLAYYMLHKHYSNRITSSTKISIIADSPVYLTPEYFLKNAMEHWNPWTLVQRTGFGYQKYKYDTSYPTQLWDYILQQGSNRDQWGFLQHINDPVSQAYYQWMNGNGYRDNRQRRLEDNQSTNNDWWSELSSSLNTIQAKHSNVNTFIMDDEDGGHCSFGLYYGLKYDGFDEWAKTIVQTGYSNNARQTMWSFGWSTLLGVLFVIFVHYASEYKQVRPRTDTDDSRHDFIKYRDQAGGDYDSDESSLSLSIARDQFQALRQRVCTVMTFIKVGIVQSLSRFASFPITAGYTMALTTYFMLMLITEGCTHPLNNPSLGPSAIGLSAYGINNPSLIVYEQQIGRLITSNLLCSGVLTYLVSVVFLWMYVRPFETKLIQNFFNKSTSMEFLVIFGSIALGSNLFYAILGTGASASACPLVLGWNAYIASVQTWTLTRNRYLPIIGTFFVALFLSVVLPFNSWILILAALLVGIIVALFIVVPTADANDTDTTNDANIDSIDFTMEGRMDNVDIPHSQSLRLMIRGRRLKALLTLYVFLFLILVLRIRRPDKLYAESVYFTGCDLYNTMAVNDIADQFVNTNTRHRWLEEQQEDDNDDDAIVNNLCAQICVPHVVSRATQWGSRRVMDIELSKGGCPNDRYEYYLDKTFRYLTYTLDVQVFQSIYSNKNQR